MRSGSTPIESLNVTHATFEPPLPLGATTDSGASSFGVDGTSPKPRSLLRPAAG